MEVSSSKAHARVLAILSCFLRVYKHMQVGVPAMLPAAVITEAQISAAIKASNETDFKNAIRAARDLVEPCPGIISAELLNVAAGNPDRR